MTERLSNLVSMQPPSNDRQEEYDDSEEEENVQEEVDDQKYQREAQVRDDSQRLTKNDLGHSVITKIQHPMRILVSGRSTLGKTTLAVDFIKLQLIPQVRRCFAVCPTWYSQNTFQPLREVRGAFPKKNVFTDVDDACFDEIFERCTHLKAPSLLIVDDAAAERATHGGNKSSFARLCIAAPHLNLSIIGCFQKIATATPSFRYNAEALIAFESTGMEDVERIIEEFNPCPAHHNSKSITRAAIMQAWTGDRFVFIHREAFHPNQPKPRVRFYSGFKHEISF